MNRTINSDTHTHLYVHTYTVISQKTQQNKINDEELQIIFNTCKKKNQQQKKEKEQDRGKVMKTLTATTVSSFMVN